jgi:hypothetical protein
MRFSVARNCVLQVSPVFDTYWRFAAARQDLFMRRLNGRIPWTKDPILSEYRFTNPYRASDRVSQYLIQKVIYEGKQTGEEIFFRTLLFKTFNRIETWQLLERRLGEITARTFDVERYASILDDAMKSQQQVYSAAYIMPSPAFGAERKHRNHLLLIDHMLREKTALRVESAKSLKEVFEVLRSQPSFGSFLAFQFTIDLNYSQMIDFSEMDFVVAGPGAQSGIRKCILDNAGLDDADIIRAVTESAEREFERLNLKFESLWGRRLQLIDCQNLFCEVDKYSRVRHPELSATFSRTRIKQRFRAASNSLPQWYPPKWRVRVPKALSPRAISKSSKADRSDQMSLMLRS